MSSLCPQCRNSPWPYLMVLFLAGFSAFLTWLIATFANLAVPERFIASLLAFLVVGGGLLAYVISCMRRHCRHAHHSHPAGPPAAGGH